jgi:Response regulator receiver domain
MLQLLHHPGLSTIKMTEKCVLVIDDEASVQWVIQSCLEDVAGWQVWVASSAREGLAIALDQKPGAIILDMMMPDMDGIGFLKARQGGMGPGITLSIRGSRRGDRQTLQPNSVRRSSRRSPRLVRGLEWGRVGQLNPDNSTKNARFKPGV